MDLPKCSVIVLNWNGKEHLDECFSSVLACNYPQKKLEVIMVDNASTDGSVEFVKANFPAVRVLALDKNPMMPPMPFKSEVQRVLVQL